MRGRRRKKGGSEGVMKEKVENKGGERGRRG